MEKVLVLGGSGLVGRAIINELRKYNKFQIYATYFQNPLLLSNEKSFKLNIEDESNIREILDTLNPQIVISCLRGDFAKQLILHRKAAEYLRENGGRMYFFSNTNVFDDDLSTPHYEEDLPSSCTDYGKYKIECEKVITEILQDNACILRIPQVWGKEAPRMKQVLKLLNSNEKVVVYPRLFINTNTDVSIAKKLSYIIERNLNGIFHLASEDIINYKEFYCELIKKLGINAESIEENYEEEGYFALLSKKSNEFPKHLRVTNKSVIEYLING